MHSDQEDEEEDADQDGGEGSLQEQVPFAAASVVEQAVIISQAISVIADTEGVVIKNFHGETPAIERTAIPISPPLEVGQGSTPITINDQELVAAPTGGSGMKALLLGAFITAVADIQRVTKGGTGMAGVLRFPGTPQMKAAAAAGLLVAASLENIESAFTKLMGERSGIGDRPEQRTEDAELMAQTPIAAAGAPANRPEERDFLSESEAADQEFQVVRPARAFLVDLSDMFLNPPTDK